MDRRRLTLPRPSWRRCGLLRREGEQLPGCPERGRRPRPHNTTDSQSDQVIWMIHDALIRYDENMKFVPDPRSWRVGTDH
jgi:hypothetical protein